MIQVIEKDLLTVTPEFADGDVIIAHQVNCQGVMGSGVALSIKRRFPEMFDAYETLCANRDPVSLLGTAQVVLLGGGGGMTLYGCNVFAQNDFGSNGLFTDYVALGEAMLSLTDSFEHSWHSPPKLYVPYLMGCDRGGGNWGAYSTILDLGYALNEVVACKLPS